jgi:hypothetical protein
MLSTDNNFFSKFTSFSPYNFPFISTHLLLFFI